MILGISYILVDIVQEIFNILTKYPILLTIPVGGIVIPLLNHYVIKPHTEEKKAKTC